MYSLSGTHLLCRCLFNKSPSLPSSPNPPSPHTNHIRFFFYWNTGAARTQLQEEPLVCRDQGSELVWESIWCHESCGISISAVMLLVKCIYNSNNKKLYLSLYAKKVISKFTYISFSSRDFKHISLISSISLQRFSALQVADVYLILRQIPYSVRITLVSVPESACFSWI